MNKPPASDHHLTITNANSKTVSIDAQTVQRASDALTVESFSLSASTGQVNTLRISGNLSTPLGTLTGFVVHPGGALVVTNGSFHDNGPSNLAGATEGSFLVQSNADVHFAHQFQVLDTGNLTIEGGMVHAAYSGWHVITLLVGYNGTGTVWVTGGQLLINDAAGGGDLNLGYNGLGQLVVSNGMVRAGSDVFVGTSSGDGLLMLAGGQFELTKASSIGSLKLGYWGGTRGTLIQTGGTLLITNCCYGIIVGNQGIGEYRLSGGTASVRYFDVGNGSTMTMNGGTLSSDQVRFIGAQSVFTFNGGTLVTKSTTGNNQPFAVGNGANTAWLQLDGGTHNFPGGLFVSTQAVVSGCGTITGPVVNNGTIISDCPGETLVFSGIVTNNGLIIATNSTVQFYGGLVNNGTVLTPTPAAPSSLQASAVSSGQINLSWTDNSSNEDGFKIERAPDNSGAPGSWAQLTTVGSNVTAYGNTGLTAHTSYWYRMRAYNAGGDSPFSNQASATTPNLPPNNSWINAASGFWQDGMNWSSSVPPDITQSAAFITNAATKTVTIDATTSGSFPGTMTISNLTMSALTGSTNALVLSHAGTNVPFRVLNRCNILTNAAMIVSNAVLQVGGATYTSGVSVVGGSLRVDTDGVMTNGSRFNVGSLADPRGALIVNGGEVRSGGIEVYGNVDLGTGKISAPQFSYLWIGNTNPSAPASLCISGGEFEADIFLGIYGTSGQVIVSNGTVKTDFGYYGIGYLGGVATFTVAGGDVALRSDLTIARDSTTGTVWVTGGQLTVTNGDIFVGQSHATLIISNGNVLARNVTLQSSYQSSSSLLIAGGNLLVQTNFAMGQYASGSTSTVWVTGGRLVITNGTLTVGLPEVGFLTQSSGLLLVRSLHVSDIQASAGGQLTQAGGTNIVSSDLVVGNCSGGGSALAMVTGGNLYVTNAVHTAILEVRGGTFTMTGGSLVVDELIVTNSCGHFIHTGGTLSYRVLNYSAALDADGDGLPNGWELTYGLDPLAPTGDNGASGDPDGDLLTNLQEYQGGTDPTKSDLVSTATNSWINASSDKWETGANWSAAVPPDATQSITLITNAGSKTVTIDATTSGSFPSTMTISNLLVSAPGGATNTLWLDNAGLLTPLLVTGNCTIRPAGLVRISNSKMQVAGVAGVEGALNLENDASLAVTGPLGIATSLGGNVILDSGSLITAAWLYVGLESGATGSVWVTGGQLVATNWMSNGSVFGGGGGVAQVVVSNGTMQVFDLFLGSSAGLESTLIVAGGTTTLLGFCTVGNGASATGAIWVTGGQLDFPYSTTLGYQGTGRTTISNGLVSAFNLYLGGGAGSQGILTIQGGETWAASSLVVGSGGCASTASVLVAGGSLFVTNAAHNAVLDVRSGTFTINGGDLLADTLVMTNSCAHFVHTGGNVAVTTLLLDPNLDADGDGLPNGFEDDYNLDPLSPGDANTDADGDGLSNLAEYLAGTDPTNSASAFRVLGITPEGTDVRITWAAIGGKTYVVQTNAVPAGDFSDLSSNIFVSGVGPLTMDYLDTCGATNVPSRFYRVRLSP